MRVAVVDIGSNSTRLLLADVEQRDGTVSPLVKRSEVTRLGEGVDARGSLSEDAIGRVLRTLRDYRGEIDSHGCEANLAVLTAAARDASNGDAFAARVREEFSLDARVLSGDEEAQLTFLGAMSGRESVSPSQWPAVVVDIGGGSTEFVIGQDHTAGFHTSLPVGVVRMSERHISSDPPAQPELEALSLDTRATFEQALPAAERASVRRAIAVAGTATSAAAIDQRLEPYDPARVEGHVLSDVTVQAMLARLAGMREDERRAVAGLHPDRAPTIVAGLVILREVMSAFALTQVSVSEHDVLFGGALRLAGID